MKQKNYIWRIVFSITVVVLGFILNYFDIGSDFLGFTSIGIWLIYVGFVMMAIVTLHFTFKRKRIIDERMQHIASISSRIVFTLVILFSFVIMVVDGIKPISLSYSKFMSWFIMGIVLVHLITYNILLKIK